MRLCFFFILINSIIFSQERCASESYRSILKSKKLQNELFINSKPKTKIYDQFNVPIVFHVIYNNNSENISDENILSQLEVLNNDYNAENSDFLNIPGVFTDVASSSGIRFCLAELDPLGNLTTGITRTFTDQEFFNMSEDKMKKSSEGGVDPWDTEKYLNIWICNLSGNLLGFSTYPGADSSLDGVVIDYNYIGVNLESSSPYNLGRTATHEIGHYFGLEHTFYAGCSDWDDCDDTPAISTSTFGCPDFPQESCGTIDMTMNFMDYTNDACMHMFTICQTEKMIDVLLNQRSDLLENNYCFYNNILENNSSKVLLNRIDLLGRNFNSHGFYLEIFDDGTVNKKVRLN